MFTYGQCNRSTQAQTEVLITKFCFKVFIRPKGRKREEDAGSTVHEQRISFSLFMFTLKFATLLSFVKTRAGEMTDREGKENREDSQAAGETNRKGR